jgi:integrase
VREAAEKMIEGMRCGTVRNRSGDVYKPSAIRGYEDALRRYVLDALGGLRLGDVQRRDVQRLADELLAEARDPSTIRNAIMPLRVLYRRALEDGDVSVNPTTGLRLPAVRGNRDRIASPAEAAALLDALPQQDRALWATALYAGLRRGELLALRWEDVDLARGVIRVERSWDIREGVVEPKSQKGRRLVPLAALLREHLREHMERTGRQNGLVFGRSATTPFNHSSILLRAETSLRAENTRRAEARLAQLEPIGLHECRHTFAALMIAAGVNAKALSTYMGHSSITITYDRYGHLMPGNEDEAAALLDAYLQRSEAAEI